MYNQQLIQLFYSSGLVSLPKATEIASHFSQKLIPKNQFFLVEGNHCNEYLFLEKGFMRAFAHDTEGNDVTTAFYSDNQVVFEVSSFFNRTISKENIQALTDSAGWYISYEQLNMLFHSFPFRQWLANNKLLCCGMKNKNGKMNEEKKNCFFHKTI